MRKWIYAGRQITADGQNRPLRLEYYLEEDQRDAAGEVCLYGICIEQYREKDGILARERETAPAISYSREFVAGLLDKLWRMRVTPTGLLEAVDDEMSERLVC